MVVFKVNCVANERQCLLLNYYNLTNIFFHFFRDQFTYDLPSFSRAYILRNFIKVAKSSTEILELDIENFLKIVSDDHLNTKDEEPVWECCLKWIEYDLENRTQHVATLIAAVRLGLLNTQVTICIFPFFPHLSFTHFGIVHFFIFSFSHYSKFFIHHIFHFFIMFYILLSIFHFNLSFLLFCHIFSFQYFMNRVKEHPLVIASKESLPLIFETLKFHCDLDMMGNTNEEVTTPALALPRVPHEIIFAIGGWCQGRPNRCVETYDTRADRWTRVPEEDPAGPRGYHGTAVIGHTLYCIGGLDGAEYFNTCRKFDAVLKTWEEVILFLIFKNCK